MVSVAGRAGRFGSLTLGLEGTNPRFPWAPSTTMLTYKAHRHYRGFGVDRDEPNQSHPVGHPMTTAERDATGIFAPHGAPAAPRC